MSPVKVLRNFDIAKASGTLHHTEKNLSENNDFNDLKALKVFN